jgi:hypothetical protein
MTSSKLKALTLCAGLALAGAALGETPKRRIVPAPQGPAAKAPASDPAEPPLKVEASFGSAGGTGGSGLVVQGRVRPLGARRGVVTAAVVAVSTGAGGTVLTLNTPGPWQGSAKLTFKNAAPPMRFTMRLARLPDHDLQSLSLTSGALARQVSNVSTGATTRYFDARGKAQEAEEGAAYTLTARRRAGGDVEVQLRRGPGAALGKELTVSWQGGVVFGQDLDGLIGRKR